MFDGFYESLINQLSLLRITDFIDIFIVTFIIYKVLKFIRDTRTVQLLKGVIVLIVVMQVSQFAKLHTVHYLLSNAMQLGLIAILIVFQPELRRALEQLGQRTLGQWFNFDERADDEEKEKVIKEVKESCINMSKSHIGALIVMERDTKIGDIVGTGITVNADVSAELLVNIFVPKTPLHDGAVIIRNNKIEAASCFLPLSQNPNVSKELGTRHRAGLGMSEESDSVVVIVSEETGNISIACGGELNMNLSPESLEKKLQKLFDLEKKDNKNKKNIFVRKEKTK
ncbi:MAG: diadenylate cyclase CdaA [Oscillospiraceae bacterium]|nr:diadenylate cyclase CdaA [Oscillospiraceae bacterium]